MQLDQRAASAASLPQPSLVAREHRAVATELINERLQAIEKSGPVIPSESALAFNDLDASFEEVTPIRKK